MKRDLIVVTQRDYNRLTKVLSEESRHSAGNAINLRKLADELHRARKVAPENVPSTVVTMNSEIEFIDLDSNTTRKIKLVYPRNADIRKGQISVTTPVGTAILGYEKGDVIEWEVPAGKKRFLIRDILYQPEANGDYMD